MFADSRIEQTTPPKTQELVPSSAKTQKHNFHSLDLYNRFSILDETNPEPKSKREFKIREKYNLTENKRVIERGEAAARFNSRLVGNHCAKLVRSWRDEHEGERQNVRIPSTPREKREGEEADEQDPFISENATSPSRASPLVVTLNCVEDWRSSRTHSPALLVSNTSCSVASPVVRSDARVEPSQFRTTASISSEPLSTQIYAHL
ncbi:unnamed protein product [Microthlaspi erraticum]|uniref:Uncharacterized protein n=1 Tax=Microthlaspi erraticum TaxID=1685480 RepID=A0A6D2JT72_9BRAS|nr:unnamed protein product [Microthlaspi erraticum]